MNRTGVACKLVLAPLNHILAGHLSFMNSLLMNSTYIKLIPSNARNLYLNLALLPLPVLLTLNKLRSVS